MKYLIVVPDGAGDEPIARLEGKTPLQMAKMPVTDGLARTGLVGMVKTIPEGIAPGSDAANLSVMGYDPAKFLTGRSPLEAASISAEPKKAPTQGVQPMEKTTPKTTEDRNPIFKCCRPNCRLLLRKGSCNRPIKCKPKTMMMPPVKIFRNVLYSTNKLPIVPANAPNKTKIRVKPRTKPNAFLRTTDLFSLVVWPAKYEM